MGQQTLKTFLLSSHHTREGLQINKAEIDIALIIIRCQMIRYHSVYCVCVCVYVCKEEMCRGNICCV